jgi:hypothetical protein
MPPRVARELARLRDYNSAGNTEGAAIGRRTRNAPSRFANAVSDALPVAFDEASDQETNSWTESANPFAFAARKVKDPDTLSWNEAMIDGPEKAKWMEAANAEIESLVKHGTWVEVPTSEATSRIIPGTWVFRRKRSPDGELKKYKARYCCRGDLENNSLDTFAPVVAWSTVRLFLVVSFLLGWQTRSVDFGSAFVQAKLKRPVWIHIPRGFQSTKGPNTCLRLIKSLYGLVDAPKMWADHIRATFVELGFTPSKFDPCLLLRKDMMIVLYVDDAGISAKTQAEIEHLVDQLRAKGFDLTLEGSFSEYLGIKFENKPDGSIHLTQSGLIDKIIEASGMKDSKPNRLPTTMQALGSDPDGLPMSESWSYSSIVGMLLYLSTNTRVDIAFAVSQVCRFSSNPKQSHATAVKSIIRYLKRTRDQGMILRPTGRLELDLYVDADFAGLHHREPDHLPDSVRSRTGYIIFLSDCPLVWKSSLQSSIAASTTEAEYTALSTALRTLLPLKRLLIEVIEFLDVPLFFRTSIRARAFEDNQSALYLATNHRLTNRTKYFLVKWHWFWQYASEFECLPIASNDQRADYLTKPLSIQPFESNRFHTQGW